MSADAKSYTEREVILRERRAFLTGVASLHIEPEIPGTTQVTAAVRRVEEKAATLYPLPKVTRQRVKCDPMNATFNGRPIMWMAREWGSKDDPQLRIVCSWDGGTTFDDYAPRVGQSILTTPERVTLWADLLANPTEECDG